MRLFFISVAIIILAALIILLVKFKYKGESQEIIAGKKIYERSCKSCHSLFVNAVGTPMYGALERIPNKKWLYDFIKNPSMMVVADTYAACLKRKYGIEMTGFFLTPKEIDAVYEYVYSEAKKRKDVWKNPKFFIPCK